MSILVNNNIKNGEKRGKEGEREREREGEGIHVGVMSYWK